MYGGTVESGQLRLVTGAIDQDVLGNDIYVQTVTDREGEDPCIRVSKNAVVTLAGDSCVENLYLVGGTAAKLTVQGNYTGTVEIGYPEGTTLEQLQKIASAEALEGVAASVSGATITFRGVEGMTAAVKDGELVVSDSPYSYIYCHHCEQTLQWTPITDAELDLAENTKGMKPGHYILTENVTTLQKQLNPDGANPGSFCFDLNGYEFHGTTRAFYVYNDAALSIQDSAGGGFVQGDKGANNYGGTMYCQGANSVINVYGTTVKGTPVNNLRGSAVFITYGTVNLYDATVEGNHSTQYGGTIFCAGTGKLNVSGGKLVAGTTDGTGSCVFLDTNAKITVAGDAVIDEVYVNGKPASAVTVDATEEAFAGNATLRFATAVSAGTDVGDITGTLGITGTLTEGGSGMAILPEGTDLKTAAMAVAICADGQALQQFATLEKALEAYTGADGSYIRLNEAAVAQATVTRDTCLDLGGFDLGGTITVAEGATLYVMDSATDDYTVLDDIGYGELSAKVTGTVLPVAENTVSAVETGSDAYRAGYLPMVRTTGISFHRVNLQVDTVTLRPGASGLYYQCPFLADEVVAEEIYSYGIALSMFGAPNADDLQTDCEYTVNYIFDGGAGGNRSNGTLLQNIMRFGNSDAVNAGNAATRIYGSAYIYTESGYWFGQSVALSLEELVCGVDRIWNDLSPVQQNAVLNMMDVYGSVMSEWEIPNIRTAHGGSI